MKRTKQNNKLAIMAFSLPQLIIITELRKPQDFLSLTFVIACIYRKFEVIITTKTSAPVQDHGERHSETVYQIETTTPWTAI